MNKKVFLILAIISVIILLIFILIRNDIFALKNNENSDIQSEVNKISKENTTQTKSTSNVNNNNEKVPVQSVQPETNINNKNSMQLEIKTIQAGSGERAVKAGDTIGVYYTGKLTNGTVFDSNVGKGVPFEFTVGAGMVIQGWEQGFIGAKVGEKRTLTIPAGLGYGERGAGSAIPPNSTLIFDVELVTIK